MVGSLVMGISTNVPYLTFMIYFSGNDDIFSYEYYGRAAGIIGIWVIGK